MADRALKLAHFFPSFSIGGQQRRLATLIDGLGLAFSHHIYSLDGDLGAAAMIGARADVTILPLIAEKSSFVSFSNLQRLKRAIRDADADILCTYNFGSIEAAIANALGPRLPHVHHEDGFGSDEAGGKQKFKRVMARRLLLSRAQVIVPSKSLENIALRSWRLNPARVTRIPVGIDLARYKKSRRTGDGPIVVGALGALRAEKNFARLIRCFEAANDGRDARLVIVGDGPERKSLEAAAAASKACDRITFAGATANPEEAFAGFDIFALSSDTEQTPTSLIEAMASGLPALATDVGDVRAMIGDIGQEFIVPPDDEAAFAAGLCRLIDDGALRRRLGGANLARAQAFGQAAMIDAFRALYLKTAGDR